MYFVCFVCYRRDGRLDESVSVNSFQTTRRSCNDRTPLKIIDIYIFQINHWFNFKRFNQNKKTDKKLLLCIFKVAFYNFNIRYRLVFVQIPFKINIYNNKIWFKIRLDDKMYVIIIIVHISGSSLSVNLHWMIKNEVYKVLFFLFSFFRDVLKLRTAILRILL